MTGGLPPGVFGGCHQKILWHTKSMPRQCKHCVDFGPAAAAPLNKAWSLDRKLERSAQNGLSGMAGIGSAHSNLEHWCGTCHSCVSSWWWEPSRMGGVLDCLVWRWAVVTVESQDWTISEIRVWIVILSIAQYSDGIVGLVLECGISCESRPRLLPPCFLSGERNAAFSSGEWEVPLIDSRCGSSSGSSNQNKWLCKHSLGFENPDGHHYCNNIVPHSGSNVRTHWPLFLFLRVFVSLVPLFS